jgi:acyl carrier protein
MDMTEQEILADLANIIVECTGATAGDVTLDADLANDLDIDSLSMVELIAIVQDELGVSIPDEELKSLRIVQDVVGYVHRAQRSDMSA